MIKQEAQIIRLPGVARKRKAGIVREIKARVDSRLDYLFDGLAANVENALFEEMWDMDEEEALRHHFNVMRALKTQSDDYRQEFHRLMNQVWLIFLRKRREPVLHAPKGIAETLIKPYQSRTESHYKVLIKEIRQRFSRLLQREIDDYPLCPEILYLCFWQSITRLDLRYDERVMLIPLFHRFVMDRYGQVLAVANQILSEYGIQVPEEP